VKINQVGINIGLALMAFSLSLVIGEIFCRYYYFGSLSIKPKTPEYEFWAYDKKKGWSPVPNSKGYFSDSARKYNGYVEFDSMGVRRNGNGFEKFDKTILVLGDSTTAGLEVDNDETYVAVLERLFRSGGSDYKFYNAGVRGYGTDQSLWRLQRLSAIIEPDYVIYMFTDNDFINNKTVKSAGRVFGKPAFIMHDDSLELYNYPAKKYDADFYSYIEYEADGYRINEGLLNDAGFIYRVREFIKYNSAIYYPLRAAYKMVGGNRKKDLMENSEEALSVDRNDKRLMKLILSRMMEVNKNLIVTSFATGDSRNKHILKQIARELGIQYLDIAPYFDANEEEYHWKGDGHWNQKGHLRAAEALHELLSPILVQN